MNEKGRLPNPEWNPQEGTMMNNISNNLTIAFMNIRGQTGLNDAKQILL